MIFYKNAGAYHCFDSRNHDIENQIEVQHPRRELTDQALVEEIKERLWWNPRVDSYQIMVVGENHDVTLTGTTDTWLERALAEEIAYESGAQHVKNHIQLRQASDFNSRC